LVYPLSLFITEQSVSWHTDIEEEIRGVKSLFGLDIAPPFMQIINAEIPEWLVVKKNTKKKN
jgi:hypothetical protein